ncbi:MAG: RNA polymerase sigma factor [Chloroflexota bacterium]
MAKNFEDTADIELYLMLQGTKKISERAFAELYKRHSARIFAYCRKMLGNYEEARDAFQETFIKFHESSAKPREMTNVIGYLYRIARNVCLNYLRNKKTSVTQLEDYMAVSSDNAKESELIEWVNAALAQLPPEFRECFVLREYEGFTYAEIAEMIGESLSTVKVRIFRARQKIREILQPHITDLA